MIEKLIESRSFKKGVSFGIVSSAMTVLGMSMGMWSSSGTLRAIIASIVGLSISNSLADGFSMYMSEIASGDSKTQALTTATITATIEFILPFLFMIPFMMASEKFAIIFNAILGFILVGTTGWYVSSLNKETHKQKIDSLSQYVLITLSIIVSTYYAGNIAKRYF